MSSVVYEGGQHSLCDCALTATVVVPAYNAGEALTVQLAALAAQDTAIAWELVVSDNGSTDETRDRVVRSAEHFHSVRIVDSSDLPGAAHARNAGARHARGANILFCDADDEASRLWLHYMTRRLSSADLVGGRLEYGKLNTPETQSWRIPVQDSGLGYYLSRPYIVSANVGIRRKAFAKLGGFDESFSGAAGEDVDFSWRGRDAGFSLQFEPAAVMHYRYRDSLDASLRQARNYGGVLPRLLDRHLEPGSSDITIRDDLRTYFKLGKRFAWATARRRQPEGSARWNSAYARAHTRGTVMRRGYWSLRGEPGSTTFLGVQSRRMRKALHIVHDKTGQLLHDPASGQRSISQSPWHALPYLRDHMSETDRHRLGAGLLADADVSILAVRDGLRFYLNPSLDAITNEVIRSGAYGSSEMTDIQSLLTTLSRGPSCFGWIVNVGANIGTTAIPLALAGYRVLAIEPSQRAFDLLCENVRANDLVDRITCLKSAVTTEEGIVELVVGDNLSTSELRNGLIPEELGTYADFGLHVEEVRSSPLLSLVQEAGIGLDDVALVWSDTEGAERGVIASATELWAQHVPLWVELRPSALADQGTVTEFCATAVEHFDTLFRDHTQLAGSGVNLRENLREMIDDLGFERYAFTNVLMLRSYGSTEH